MSPAELLSFLLPNLQDPVQAAFFSLIFGLVAVSLALVKKNAVGTVWDNNWNHGTPDNADDDLDSEHGSIHDLSEALASRSEKFAEALPGILLVIGLLGTFIGLGVSLNKAAAALHNINDVAGQASAMGNLMSMLQGLGIKFKASTWGIIGFLAMRIASSHMGYHDARLRWCIRKVKGQIDSRRHLVARTQEDERQALLGAIEKLGTDLCGAFESHMTKNTTMMVKAFAEMSGGLQAMNTGLSDIARQNREDRAITHHSVKEMGQELASAMRTNAVASTKTLTKSLDGIIERIEATRMFIVDSASQNRENLVVMRESAVEMKSAVTKLSGVSKDLQKAVGELGDGISSTLDKIKDDLGGVISDMNVKLDTGIRDMSQNIGQATQNISAAVTDFSENISETMNGVANLMKESDKRQTMASAMLADATEAMSTSANAMSGNLGKIGTEISSGLKAISTGNQKVETMLSGFEKLAAQLDKVINALTSINLNPFSRSKANNKSKSPNNRLLPPSAT